MADRRRLPAELEHQLRDAVAEATHALARIRSGNPSAFRTLLHNLRLLVGPGRGDDLLQRVAAAKGVTIRPVWLSQPPASRGGATVVFSYGPAFYLREEDPPPDSVQVGLMEALAAPCLTMRGATGGDVDLSWLGVVKTVADKVAVHADEEVPSILDSLDRLIVTPMGGMGLEHTVQRVASVVLPIAQEVLDAPT